MQFILFLFVALLSIGFFRLHSRITQLERRLPTPSPVPPPTASLSTPLRPDIKTDATAHITPVLPKEPSFDPIEWFKRDWLLKLGGVLVLFALGWFVSYAFIHNWIGPSARIALGLVAGVIFLIVGWERMLTHFHQGSVFLVLGSGTVILTLYAARLIYHFFTPVSALLIMFLSAVVVAGASVRYRSQMLAYLGLLLATAAPFFIVSTEQNPTLFFAYLLVVLLGTAWLLFQNRVPGLPLTALGIVFYYSTPYFLQTAVLQNENLLWFAFALILVIFIMNTVVAVKDFLFPAPLQILLVGGNTLLLIIWILAVAPDEWQSPLLLAWMGGIFLFTFLLRFFTQQSSVFISHSLAIVALLATVTAIEFDGPVLTIAFIVESLFLPLIAWLLSGNIRQAGTLSLFIVLPSVLSVQSITSSAWQFGIWHEDFVVLLLLASSFLTLGFFFRLKSSLPTDDIYHLASFYLVTGSVFVYTLVWLSLHAVLTDANIATLLSYVIYTIIGISFYIQGRSVGRRGWKQYGSVLVLLVVGRLLLVDVWTLELSGRIMTFFLVGFLLMSTAFLERKK